MYTGNSGQNWAFLLLYQKSDHAQGSALSVSQFFYENDNSKTRRKPDGPCLFSFSFLIGEKLLYNVALLSVIQQCKSIIITYIYPLLPGGSVVKNPPVNAGATGSIPGSGRSPGEKNGPRL